MTDSYIVLSRDRLEGPLAPVSRAVAGCTGEVVFDVTRRLRDDPGTLATGLTRDQADRVVGALSQARVPAFALPESSRVVFPDPVLLETAKLGPDALDVQDLRDADNRRLGSVRVPYRDIVFIAAAQVKIEKEKRVVESTGSSYAPPLPGSGAAFGMASPALGLGAAFLEDGGSGLDAGRTVRRVTKTEIQHVLDIYAVEPAHHLRLPATTFNFVLTGLKIRPTSILNLCEFIRSFVPRCETVHVDPSVRCVIDGDPLTNLKFGGMHEYDGYLDWRIQLLYHPQD
jgi:hypothetical protein